MSMELLHRIFLDVANMSLAGSLVIGVVLAVRLLLRRLPRIYSYVLWGVVLFRLLCPVSLTADFSLMGVLDPVVEPRTEGIASVELLPETLAPAEAEPPQLSQTGGETALPPPMPETHPVEMLSWVWLAGLAVMICYSLWSWLRLRRRLAAAVPAGKNLWLADHIRSPFVLGLFRPRIYLPSSLGEREQRYILLHERYHIRRGDPLWKVLGFAALSLHWFNPLVWLAFVLAGRDMEMSCDEAVVARLGEGIRKEYSASLLNLAVGRPIISGMPLAFGEGDTKERVIHVLNWKKPKKWMKLAGSLCCLLAVAACGVNPGGSSEPKTGELLQPETLTEALAQRDWDWYVSEEETMIGREHMSYSLRSRELHYGETPEGAPMLMCGVKSMLFEGEPILTVQFVKESNPGAAGDEDEVFSWADSRERVILAAELYGMESQPLADTLEASEPEESVSGQPVYMAEQPDGFCAVQVVRAKPHPRSTDPYVNHVSYAITVYLAPSRTAYDRVMQWNLEESQKLRENPDLIRGSIVTLGGTWSVAEGDDTVLTLTVGGETQKAEKCWSGGLEQFRRLAELPLLPCQEHPYRMEGGTVTLENGGLTLTVWEAAPWFGILDSGEEELWLRSTERDTDLWQLLSGWAEAALTAENG